MNLLLDTHIFIGLIDKRSTSLPPAVQAQLKISDREFHLSVASLWEIAIKYRIGKLPPPHQLDLLPKIAADIGVKLLEINAEHALADIDPEPSTRDPFDRLLLAQCKVEGLKLVTIDRALIGHPLTAEIG